MKFRSSETGKVFDTINEAVGYVCQQQEECGEWCPLYCKRPIPGCRKFYSENPVEAARLMGYEVVYEPGDDTSPLEVVAQSFSQIGKEANMDKPLKDWTMGEVQEYCDEHECGFCELFQRRDCLLNSSPDKWSLSNKPRFTQQEVEDAKTIKRMFGSGNFSHFTHIQKDEMGRPAMVDCPMGDDWRFLVGLAEGMFPSLRPEETVTLDEIIGGGHV